MLVSIGVEVAGADPGRSELRSVCVGLRSSSDSEITFVVSSRLGVGSLIAGLLWRAYQMP